MGSLEEQSLEQEVKEQPIVRNPLDPLSKQKPILTFLLISYKHIEKLPPMLTHALTFITITLVVSTILSEARSSDLLYQFLSSGSLQVAILISCIALNLLVFIFFVICYAFKSTFLTRAEASPRTKFNIVFFGFAIVTRLFYFVIFPVQCLLTLIYLKCDRKMFSEGYCSSVVFKVYTVLFILNMIVSICYIAVCQSTLIGIHNNKDPMSTTVLPKLEIFQVNLILVQLIKNIIEWNAGEMILKKRFTYGVSFLLSFGYIAYYKCADGRFNRIAGKIYYMGLGLISWLSFRQFVYSIIEVEYVDISGRFENLILILEISLCLKITWNLLLRLSNEYKFKAEKSLFDDMMIIKDMVLSTECLLLVLDFSSEEINLDLVNLKGMYKNHQMYCNDIKCSCQKRKDVSFGRNNLHRFRDFYLNEMVRLIDKHPKNFYVRFYYVYYIMKYERNLKKLTVQLQNLKSLIGNSFLNSLRYLQIEIMIESNFNEVYKEKKKVDGLEISSIGETDLDNVTAGDAMKFLIKNAHQHSFLKFYDFITIDRLFNEMLDRMRDSIDVHQIFLYRLQKKHTNLRTIHNLVQLLIKLNKKVDKVYLRLKEQAFKYTTLHLLPYGFFKNQTQNSIRECNIILREYKQKIQTSGKIFAKLHNKIKNINIEKDSVCFLLSIAQDTFMDIIYVTRSYERIFGADISFLNANLMDILPPTTSELHQDLAKQFLSRLKRKYFSLKKTGLLCLKQYLLDEVSYIVNLFPSILLEPMLILYVKKRKVSQNKYLIALNRSGKIEGCSENLLELYPDIMDLMGSKVYTVCKGLKEDIANFRYYELAVIKSSQIGKSLLYPGFRKSRIKKYREEWMKMEYKSSKGKTAIFGFSSKFQIEVNFKLRIDYYHIDDRSSHTIWLSFKVENELQNVRSFRSRGLTKKLMMARKGLSRITYVNKLKLFQTEDDASKEIRMMFGGNKIDDKTKHEINKKRAVQDLKLKTKIHGEGEDKRIKKQQKNNKRIERPNFFRPAGQETDLDKLRKKHKQKKEEKEKKAIVKARKKKEKRFKGSEQYGKFIESAKSSFTQKITEAKQKAPLNLKYMGFMSIRYYKGKIGKLRQQKKAKKHTGILTTDNLLSFEQNLKVRSNKVTEGMDLKENLGRKSSDSGSLRSTKFSNIFAATNNPSVFRLSKYNLVILLVQIINISIAFLTLIIVRFYYTDRNVSYVTENKASELFVYITNNIKGGYDDIIKLSLIQSNKLPDNRFSMLLNTTNNQDVTSWYEDMGLDNAELFYKTDLQKRVLKTHLYTKELHDLVSKGVEADSLELIYDNFVDVVYYERFTDDVEEGKKETKMNAFNLINYMVMNFKQMLKEDNFSYDSVMFRAIDYNVPLGIRKLIRLYKQLFGEDEVERFTKDTDFAVQIIIYCSIIITLLTFTTIPAFYKIRKTIIKIYRTLEDLYDFELKYKMNMLDELEDALDVCQESMKVVEGLIQVRTK